MRLSCGYIDWLFPAAYTWGMEDDFQRELSGSAADEAALWYKNPPALEFTARIREARPRKGMVALVLDTKGFFPGGGGQPGDRGSIAGTPLTGIAEEDGVILHFVDEKEWRALFPGEGAGTGETVSCRVDAQRRTHFAQQHTGQHILSACLKKVLDVDTLSVHFGEEISTIETAAENIPEEDLRRAETAANAVIASGAEVSCVWIDAADMSAYKLRRLPDLKGRVRIVRIGDIDTSACCGVHLRGAASLGCVIITGTEKIRGRTRLGFITGGRVVQSFHGGYEILKSLREKLSCKDEDLPRAVEALLCENRETKKRLGEFKGQLYRYAAAELAAQAPECAPAAGIKARFITAFLEGASGADLSEFTARCLETGPAVVCVCDAGKNASPKREGRVSWIAAHNAGKETDLKTLLPELLAAGGGKGGGSPLRFQGSFPGPASYNEFLGNLKKIMNAGQ
jgi:alanyl-tRNA synthetase